MTCIGSPKLGRRWGLNDVEGMGQRVTSEMEALRHAVRALVRDDDEISDVVEPLQSATDRVGRVADRLPGGGHKR
jgi:nanoRNase/pAp phosphatase (c-di-AMP/oligoRNAs hydrolase)